MVKIILVCSAGMSTSMLVNKMKAAADEQGIEIDIAAIPEAEAKEKAESANVVLLAPQVRYLLSKMKENLDPKGVPVVVIDGLNYGMMNGKAVLKQALDNAC